MNYGMIPQPAEAINALSDALRRLVPHFPFSRNGTLYCDCGWYLDNGGKLDWWAHVEEVSEVRLTPPVLRVYDMP